MGAGNQCNQLIEPTKRLEREEEQYHHNRRRPLSEMHIKEIVVDGFKSYAHRTVIAG